MTKYIVHKLSELCASDICDYLEEKHHQYCRDLFPDIMVHLHAAEKVDGSHNNAVRNMRFPLELLEKECDQHLRKEEYILFPFIRQMELQVNEVETGAIDPGNSHISNPISLMESDHRRHRLLLEQVLGIVSEIEKTDQSSPTLLLLLREVRDMAANYEEHISIQQDILFPKALELERRIKTEKNPPTNNHVS